MALLPQLEALYKKWHEEGLEIVGINFDEKAETGQKRCKSLGITYPQVWVPSDEKTRELWKEASGIGSVPRLFLIDRDGILRADTAENLEKKVAELVKKTRAEK
jgi:peroxiredoxin